MILLRRISFNEEKERTRCDDCAQSKTSVGVCVM